MNTEQNQEQFKDKIDFRDRYQVPEHFTRDRLSLNGLWYYERMNDVINLFDPDGKEVLDLGCGDGFFSKMLIEKGFKVTGVDYTDRAILFAKAMNPEATFELSDIRTFKTEKKFDQVAFIAVLEHIDPQYSKQILQNVNNMLKENGRLVILLPSQDIPVTKYHYKHYSESEIRDMLEEAGFAVERVVRHNRYTRGIRFVYNYTFYRFLKNRFYDLTFIRRILKSIYEHFFRLPESGKCMLFTAVARKK